MADKVKKQKPKKDGILKRWIGYKNIKENNDFGQQMIDELKKPGCQIVETFEEAKDRLGFTNEGMKNAYRRFFFMFFAFIFSNFLILGGIAYLLVVGNFWFIIPSLVIMFALTIRMLDCSLRCYQIRFQEMIGIEELLTKHKMEIIPAPFPDNYKLKTTRR